MKNFEALGPLTISPALETGAALPVQSKGLASLIYRDVVRLYRNISLLIVLFLCGGKTLEILTTVEDPDTYYRPWQAMLRFERVQEARGEEICREGNFTLFSYGIPIDETPDFLSEGLQL